MLKNLHGQDRAPSGPSTLAVSEEDEDDNGDDDEHEHEPNGRVACGGHNDAVMTATENDPLLPTEDLPLVADSIPGTAWLVIAIEICERFAALGSLGPLQNYIQLPASGGLRHGGLGLGQRKATSILLLYNIWCYTTPLLAGIVADQYLGRYRTILYGAIVYIVGLAFLTGSSMLTHMGGSIIPSVGLFIAMTLVGVGTGSIKPNVNALLAEQYVPPENNKVQLRNGQLARIDYEATIQRMFLVFYMLINFGAFSGLITAEVEHKYGFTPAFGLSLLVFTLGTTILVTTSHLYKKATPSGSVLPHVCKIIKIALYSGGNLDSAKPENLSDLVSPWTSELVEDVRKALYACRVFLFYPFFWCAYSQIITNLVSQAGTMDTGSIPNDIFVCFSSFLVITISSLFDRFIYPFLHRRSVSIIPTRRIALGFFFTSLSMAYTTLVQKQIYLSPPCYNHPLSADCDGGQIPNQISVFFQLPTYILMAIAEILVAVTGLEFAFSSAPKSMKSVVMAIFLLTNAAGMVLAIAFGQIAEDPNLTWFYGSLFLEVFIATLGFCYVFRHSIVSGKLF